MPYPQHREPVSFDARSRKFVLSLGEADLTNAVNGSPQDFALGSAPAGAVLFAPPNLRLITQFTGGGAASVGLSIGTAGAPTLVATSFNVFGGAASGLFVAMTAGAQVVVPAGGQSLIARVTPDGAHNLAALTAGSLVLEVYFAVPDSKYA